MRGKNQQETVIIDNLDVYYRAKLFSFEEQCNCGANISFLKRAKIEIPLVYRDINLTLLSYCLIPQ